MDEEELAILLAINDFQELEDNLQNPRRRFLRRGKPFDELSERQFIKYFRLSKELARALIELVSPFIPPPTRPTALSVEVKVLVALKFYGYGSYQEITGTNMYTGVSQSSVCRAIEEVTSALNRPEIFNEWIKFPSNLEELHAVRGRMYRRFGMPGAIGCIDCTHVAVVPPRGDDDHPENIYVNRKGYHSINVQLTCDEKLKIIHVNSRFPGNTHDAHIWRNSNLSTIMERIYRTYPGNTFFLLGDSGYPLRPWLMTPLRAIPEPGTPEERFQNVHKRARNTIERLNGVFKCRFRCLLKDRVLHYHPIKASQIINACCVLHNMCINQNIPMPEIEENVFEGLDVGNGIIVEANDRNNDLVQGRLLQTNIINNHFRN